MITKAQSLRIDMLRTILIFGIIVVHVPPHMDYAPPHSDVWGMFRFALSNALFRAAVPTLTVVSGYLLFQHVERLRYADTVRKKSERLLWPFLLWNLPFVALLYAIEAAGMQDHQYSFQLYPFDWRVMADAAFAWRDGPVNYPLNFLRDLYLLMLAFPVVLWMARRLGWAGLVLVYGVFILDLDGPLIGRGLMPACFYAGAMLALRKVDLGRFDHLWPLAIMLLLAGSAIVAWFDVHNLTLFTTLAPPLIWIAASPLADTKAGRWLAGLAEHSFFVFLSHSFLVLALQIVWDRLLPNAPYMLFWLVTPFVAFAVLVWGYRVLHSIWPRLADLLIGKFPARAPARRISPA